jgi:hypothetical protein
MGVLDQLVVPSLFTQKYGLSFSCPVDALANCVTPKVAIPTLSLRINVKGNK